MSLRTTYLVTVSMELMLAMPLPSSPTITASAPSKSSSAVGSCRVPSLFFNLATFQYLYQCQ